jgi:RNA polymerase sigma-70 factor, ECF subfamily
VTTAKAPADGELVARFRAAARADRAAVFDEIFVAHRARVLALCHRLCGGRALAEDALQETFLEVYKGLVGFRGDAQLATWIFRLAMRTALRLRARHPAPVEPRAGAEGAVELYAALAARDQARRVQAALDDLPAEQRVVIALFAVDGLRHAEIAEILGIPEGTVWSRLHQGRKALAAALA